MMADWKKCITFAAPMEEAPLVKGYRRQDKLHRNMKVMKFGGTSVGSVKSILSLKKIVETEARTQPVVVVVSALDGITDKLIATSQMAKQGDERYREEFDAMVTRHHQMIEAIIQDDKKRIDLFNNVDQLFDQLKSIFYGVYLIHDLSKKTEDAIVSYGERLSSHIVAAMVKNGARMNSRDFIRTEKKQGKHVIDADLTTQLVKEAFKEINNNQYPITNNRVYVVPGFIARDRDTHETTNLGRGGSDYTASIIAAVLNAEVLEIWTCAVSGGRPSVAEALRAHASVICLQHPSLPPHSAAEQVSLN